jgi:hypothetical protein
MADRETLYHILDYILNKASSDELGVISEALKRRSAEHRSLGGIDPRGMAESMAKNVKQQLGRLGDIGEIARKMVADIVREKEPGITDEELEVLLNTWLPGTRMPVGEMREPPPESEQSVPPDVLITMVSQFLAACTGTMTADERRELPEDWRERYWERFPHDVRELIDAHLGGGLGEVEFWRLLVASVGR